MPPNQTNQQDVQKASVASLRKKKLETTLENFLTPSETDTRPVLVFLAGCNGAGKSTFFDLFSARMRPKPVFLNADLLARVLQGIPAADHVSQKMTDILREHMLTQGTTFVTETVFSDEVGAKLDYLKRAAAAGFRVVLIYVSLDSWGLSKMRVEYRVTADNGHGVDPAKLQRRYVASHENARRALAFVEDAFVFDNSFRDDPLRLVATTHQGHLFQTFAPVSPHLANIFPPGSPKVPVASDVDEPANTGRPE